MKEKFYSLWTTGHGLYVLLGLLFLGIFVLPVLIVHVEITVVVVEFVFAMILIIGVFTAPCSRMLRLGMLIIAILAVVTRVLNRFYNSSFTITNADNVLAVITLVAFSILIIKHFFLNKTLFRYRIAAAVAIYLILGLLWARLYEIVYLVNPAAFSLDQNINPLSLIYFSFVTLITLGYGDIVPLSAAARSLAILEGIVGQLYTVILISFLIAELSASSVHIKSKPE